MRRVILRKSESVILGEKWVSLDRDRPDSMDFDGWKRFVLICERQREFEVVTKW